MLLSLTDGSRHGYGVKREVEERTDGKVRLAAGSLYEGIQRLENSGLIAETDAPADPETRTSSRQRFYGITVLGRQVLREEIARLEADLAVARARVG
jgi:DNA-binding PadR family transcriptional regulator